MEVNGVAKVLTVNCEPLVQVFLACEHGSHSLNSSQLVWRELVHLCVDLKRHFLFRRRFILQFVADLSLLQSETS